MCAAVGLGLFATWHVSVSSIPSDAQQHGSCRMGMCETFRHQGLVVRIIEDLVVPTKRFPTRQSLQPPPWTRRNVSTWMDVAVLEYREYSNTHFFPVTVVRPDIPFVFWDDLSRSSLPRVGWVMKASILSGTPCAMPIDAHTRWHKYLPKCRQDVPDPPTRCPAHTHRDFACCGRAPNAVIDIQRTLVRKGCLAYNQIHARWNASDIIGVFARHRQHVPLTRRLTNTLGVELPRVVLDKKSGCDDAM